LSKAKNVDQVQLVSMMTEVKQLLLLWYNLTVKMMLHIDDQQVAYSLCEGAFTAISCSSASFYSALRLLPFFVCIYRRLMQFVAFNY
jgi:hypothetical protein